jgi:hypothetical protein
VIGEASGASRVVSREAVPSGMPVMNDERPPLFKSWRGLYGFVIGALVVEIIVCTVVSWLYR